MQTILTYKNHNLVLSAENLKCIRDLREIAKDKKFEGKIRHDGFFVYFDDYDGDLNDIQVTHADDTLVLEKGWSKMITAKKGWIHSEFTYSHGENDKSPIIGYAAGGHVSPHHDPMFAFTVDSHDVTYLACLDSTDSEGGTNFWTASGPVLLKGSVTPGQAVLFPGYFIHSGKPVSDGKMKVIVQNILRQTRQRVDKSSLIKINLIDGSFIIRREEWDLYRGPIPRTLTKKEFTPTYYALRGHPVADKVFLDPNNVVFNHTTISYDEVEEGFFNTLDEAAYYAEGKPLVAIIHFTDKEYEVDEEDFAVFCGRMSRVIYNEGRHVKSLDLSTKVKRPFISHGKFETFSGPDQGYMHVAWKIKE